MAFNQTLTPASGPRRADPSTVAMSCVGAAGSRRHIAVIVIGAAILTELGWKRGDRLALTLGDQTDSGWIELACANLGFRLTRAGPNRLALSTGALADDQKHSVGTVDHRVKNGALYVRLPEWAAEAARLATHAAE